MMLERNHVVPLCTSSGIIQYHRCLSWFRVKLGTDRTRCDAMLRAFSTPQKAPSDFQCGWTHHTLHAVRCDASKSGKASVGLFIAHVTLAHLDAMGFSSANACGVFTQTPRHRNSDARAELDTSHRILSVPSFSVGILFSSCNCSL